MSHITSRIAALAWPLLIGQLAVMGNGVIDTVMAGHLSPEDVAAIGLGASIYVTVNVAAMGVVASLAPVISQHFGAGRLDAIRVDFAQGLWLAALLAVPGCLLLAWTDMWMSFSQPPLAVAERTRTYLWAVAAGLPGALLFRVFHSLTMAVARPKALMAINLIGLALKIPLNALFINGLSEIGLPAMGGPGCGVATAVIAWLSVLMGIGWLRLHPWYRGLRLFDTLRPSPAPLWSLLRLGLPIGASYLVEITSFTFMAIFVARLGATVGASHQITANLAGVAYMLGLAVSNASSVLVGQAIGAGDRAGVRRTVRQGLRIVLALSMSVALMLWWLRGSLAGLYSTDAVVIAATIPLIAWLAVFHAFDAAQTFMAYVLRAFNVVTLPMVIHVGSFWIIGLGAGWWLTFGDLSMLDPLARVFGHAGGAVASRPAGAAGFWIAATAGLVVASAAMSGLLAVTLRRRTGSRLRRQPPGTEANTVER